MLRKEWDTGERHLKESRGGVWGQTQGGKTTEEKKGGREKMPTGGELGGGHIS